MDLETLRIITDSVFTIVALSMYGVFCLVKANRPASDRETMLHGLPPATAPAPVRLQQLRGRARRIVRWHLLTAGPAIGLVFLVIGLIAIIVNHLPFGIGALVALLYAAFMMFGWELIATPLLVARYYGAKKRILLDAQQQGLSDVRQE